MKRQNRVAFFNILSTILLRGISIFTAPLFTRLLGTGGYVSAVPSVETVAEVTSTADMLRHENP